MNLRATTSIFVFAAVLKSAISSSQDGWIPSVSFPAHVICASDTKAIVLFQNEPGMEIIVGDSVKAFVDASKVDAAVCRPFGTSYKSIRGPLLVEVAEVDRAD